jgi:hypothetical protein
MPALLMIHNEDPSIDLWKRAGDLSEIDIFNNDVLVAVYCRPKTTMVGGKVFYLTDQTVEEDQYQSKTGIILKKGPSAFKDPNRNYFDGEEFNEGDWVGYRPSDGWAVTLVSKDPKTGEKHELLCRILDDMSIRMRARGNMPADRIY